MKHFGFGQCVPELVFADIFRRLKNRTNPRYKQEDHRKWKETHKHRTQHEKISQYYILGDGGRGTGEGKKEGGIFEMATYC